MIKMTTLFMGLVISVVFTIDTQPSNVSISFDEAQKLVEAAIYPNASKAELDKMDNDYQPDFIFFEAIDPNSQHGAHMGTYAVNVSTGDVWNTAGACTLISSIKLDAMQKAIRAHSSLSSEQFDKLHAKRPECDSD